MRRSISLMLCLPVLALAGCARTPEALISRQVAILDETAGTLSTITDEVSAGEAAPKLAELQQEFNSLVPHVKALKLSNAAQKKLEDEHRDEMQGALERYQTELARVRKLDLKVGGLSELEEAIAE
ncbi:MAG: hypothetical protein WD894_21445 [Pirellulales bacterium]